MFWQRAWYRQGVDWRLWLLLPLNWLFVALSYLRKALYQVRILSSYRAPVPIIVVGNISVGGTGKTPVTEALVQWLKNQGHRPAIISRGYGGQGPFPQAVTASSLASAVGDEPKLLAERTGVPLVVGPNRKHAIEQLLLRYPDISVIVSDDGLQHYALQRDVEIVVVDGERGCGNGWRLPLGPLREPVSRLSDADFIVQNGAGNNSLLATQGYKVWPFSLKPSAWRRVDNQQPVELAPGDYAAVAGIGNPQRFFTTLSTMLESNTAIKVVKTVGFADHHPFSEADFKAYSTLTGGVLMTEKDAAKCQPFAAQNWYYLPVSAEFELAFWQQLAQQLPAKITVNEPGVGYGR